MNDLSEKMQERLDKWQNKNKVLSQEKPKSRKTPLIRGGDFGDVQSIEEWEEEIKLSQTRR